MAGLWPRCGSRRQRPGCLPASTPPCSSSLLLISRGATAEFFTLSQGDTQHVTRRHRPFGLAGITSPSIAHPEAMGQVQPLCKPAAPPGQAELGHQQDLTCSRNTTKTPNAPEHQGLSPPEQHSPTAPRQSTLHQLVHATSLLKYYRDFKF